MGRRVHAAAKGPAEIYPHTFVNGRLDYDYETGNWLTDGIRFKYQLNGQDVEDVVTGSIKWVEDPQRASNGKGQYEFNLRFNEDKNKPAAGGHRRAGEHERELATADRPPAPGSAGAPEPRRGMPSVGLDESEFRLRFISQFADPAFETLGAELDRIAKAAWRGFSEYRKWPRTRKAGPDFADPDFELGVEWLEAHEALKRAQAEHENPSGAHSVLIVNGSSRSEHSCPGEMSKSWRLAEIAAETCRAEGAEVELLNLSRLAAEYGRRIHPCKACFSTAAALCHWPCSCSSLRPQCSAPTCGC